MTEKQRYRNVVYDNARWDGFVHRPGDIVIATPPKSGTTWTQMLCALLIFDTPVFPDALDRLSPWMDMNTRSVADVRALLEAQQHRRFIKTHTPLDGLDLDDRVTYIFVGRDPRDVAISMEHHMANLDFEVFFAVRERAVGNDDLAELGPMPEPIDDPAERFRAFVEGDPTSRFSLAGVRHHLSTGWEHRHDDNVALFHYSDLQRDPLAEFTRLADVLEIERPPERLAELVVETELARMRDRATELAPEMSANHWRDPRQFFRRGGSGEWLARTTEADRARYEARVAELVEPDLASWAHHGWHGAPFSRVVMGCPRRRGA